MKRLLSLVALFATLQASAQQVNPVPDYVFANRMSAGRNTVTDTAAYFSIGPRYGATRGMMPPMVVDTASFSGNKRNGLLIFSVQKNKFLYWDSVGVKWAEMAGTGGSAITGSGVAGYMPEFTTATNLDTTRLYHSAGRFAIGSTTTSNGVFNVYGGQSYFDTSLKVGSSTFLADESKNNVSIGKISDKFALIVKTKTETNQPNRGIGLVTSDWDSATATGSVIQIGLNASSGNTIGIINSFSNGTTVANTAINPLGGDVLIATSTDNGNYGFQVSGDSYFSGTAVVAASTGNLAVGHTSASAKLDVRVSAGDIALFRRTDAGNALVQYNNANTTDDIIHRFRLNSGSGNFYDLRYYGTGGYFGLQYNGNNGLHLTTSSEVLINTTSDAGDFRLQVNGNALFSGNIRTAPPSGGTANDWRLGTVATVSPTSPNRTIEVSIGGTIYYIHAKTTND